MSEERTERIIVGVDGSVPATRAVEWVAGHASGSAEIILCNVRAGERGPDVREQERIMAKALERLGELRRGAMKGVAMWGDPAGEIVRLAREAQATLIVVGRRGVFLTVPGGGSGKQVGSVTSRVVEEAPCNVTVIAG